VAEKKQGTPGGRASITYKAKPKKKKTGKPEAPAPSPRLKSHYAEVVRPGLRKKFGFTNDWAVPRLTKVVVSMGIGDAHEKPQKLEALIEDVETVTGQRPVVTRARISVANFKLREGMANGLKVTLRGPRMWEFLDRLITTVVPRMRDFRGLSPKAFDGRGNYSVGLPDQLVFPEIRSDKIEHYHGMNVAVCTTSGDDEQARELLRLMGFPFRDLDVEVLGARKES
jgi:large subunit ribosomal protein L5